MGEDNPDLALLAKRYLDLWQNQLGAMANDPVLAQNIAQVLEAMGKSAQLMTAAAFSAEEIGKTGEKSGDETTPTNQSSNSAPRPAPAFAQPAFGPSDWAKLDNRLALIEERLNSLESQSEGRRRKAATKPEAGKSGKISPKPARRQS